MTIEQYLETMWGFSYSDSDDDITAFVEMDKGSLQLRRHKNNVSL